VEPGDTCEWANDGECDEPMYCPIGTDATDCDEPVVSNVGTIDYVSNPIGSGDLGPIVFLSRDTNDVGTTVECLRDPVTDSITITANTPGHDLFIQARSPIGYSSCNFGNDDVLEFEYVREGAGAFWIDEFGGYSPAAYIDCTATGLDGPFVDIRFGADQGLYRIGDADDGLADRVEITDGEIRCYWSN
jgi:hypothetical protein